MSANSKPPAPTTISKWLAEATHALKAAGINSARLDALILLEDALGKDRSLLLAHGDEYLPLSELKNLNTYIAQRAQHIPLAYIRGFIEFYGRRFEVNPRVLIPRPETEEMIELIVALLNLPRDNGYRPLLIDVGTGSGCIGITARLERPELEVWLTDVDEDALAIARRNFRHLKDELRINTHWKMQYHKSDLLDGFATPHIASIITANLPYVTKGFEISPDARHEPELALFAEDEGYQLIERLIPQAAEVLLPGGYLLLESDPWQQDRIVGKAKTAGFKEIERRRFHVVLRLEA